jgi:hypothetical protein
MSPFRFSCTRPSLSLAPDPSITETCGRCMALARTCTRNRQTDILQPSPHFHDAHKPFPLDANKCAKDAKESTTSRSTRGVFSGLELLGLSPVDLLVIFPYQLLSTKQRTRAQVKIVYPPHEIQAASGVNRRISPVSKNV